MALAEHEAADIDKRVNTINKITILPITPLQPKLLLGGGVGPQ
jgi:hypothetical protein